MVERPAKTRPRLFLIDGYALIYRAYFAMINRPLTTTYGENTSAAFGFTRFLMKIREEHEPDYIGIVLDAGTSARVERYPAYKATREKMPTDLEASLPRIRDLMKAFRVPVIQVPDHEADDVIGTLADRAADRGLEAVIVSGDKDFYQLIRPGVSLLNPGRGGQAMVEEEWVDTRNAADRLGVPPDHVVDYLALIGDASDNIPGARGIGPKTAIQLIDRYGPVENIISRSDEIGGKRAREAIRTSAADIRLSKELITIQRDLPIELDLSALEIEEPDTERLRALFVDLEFHSLAKDLGAPEEQVEAAERDYRVADTVGLVQEVVDAARSQGRFALAVEPYPTRHASRGGPVSSTGTAMRGEVVGLALALESGPAYYLPLGHRTPGELDFEGSGARNLPALDSTVMRPLADLLRDPEVDKIGHDLKVSLLLLRRLGVELGGIAFDTEVASYVIDPGRRDQQLDSLALQHLGHKALKREDVCGKGRDARPLPECAVESVRDYVAERAELSLRLHDRFAAELAPGDLDRLFRDIEMPLLRVLAEMEWTGICIDRAFFTQLEAKLAKDLALIKAEIYKVAGEEFNISSTPQLRTILFDKLELPVLRKTKTGPSTDAAVLEELAEQGHALPKLILEYRQLDKLKGTYVDALPLQIDPRTGRIHTRFSQTVAATGRLSSSDPNLQNIPIRTDVGASIRKGFIPAPGYRFLAADYSQIELRVMAHFSGDPAFVDAFRAGVDIHRQTAAIMFDVPIDRVTSSMRAAAKTVNFATLYGIGPFALSHQLGTSTAEAKSFIEQYFAKLPDVRRYLDEQITMAREQGYVQTIVGRRRYIPEIRSRNYNIRQFGERAATNAPVQGSAADIIKIAMIRIHDALRARDLGARMLLQVHDELVFEVPEDHIDECRTLVRDLMENAFELEVPLEVATGVGTNWWECK